MENVTTLKLNLDASEAVKGLKQLQREARKTVQALREVEQAYTPNRSVDSTYESYLSHVLELCSKDAQPRYINRQLYDAIVNDEFQHITIHYHRCDGATTSAIAALKTFNELVLVTYNNIAADGLKRLINNEPRVFAVGGRPLNLYTSNVIILDCVSRRELERYYTLHENQRTITLCAHE